LRAAKELLRLNSNSVLCHSFVPDLSAVMIWVDPRPNSAL